ncbi:obscurin-like protein 1, partial [Leucoraja erinacea]|uniref:obscurin-like protein 1 n=1 Tax=Leucoraja erinaceus TaxID=7782 RepID=UPI002456704E
MDVFGGAPRFVAYPRTYTVPDGADAVLKCQIAGDPRPTVVWERDKSRILPSARHRLLEDSGVYQLVVTEARLEDSGQYVCKAKNAVGETYAAATLRVREGGGCSDKPTFLVRPSSARVSRGDDVVFAGRLGGNPPPTVTWDKDGRELGQIFESGHYSVGREEGEGWHHLKIFGARPPDAGVYLCRAANVYGQSMAAAVLLVDPGQIQPPPPPPPPPHPPPPTTTMTTPPPTTTMTMTTPPPTTTMTVDSPEGTPRREGAPRRAAVKVKGFAVCQGKHAKFRCRVTGKPKPEIYWCKDGEPVAAGRRHLLYEDRDGYFNLKMLYCRPGDGGLYTCAASNSAGNTLSSVLLHITEPQTKFRSQLRDVEVRERERAVLECEVPAGSVPSAWYLEDRRLRPSAKYVIEQRGALRRLTINDVTMDDDGVYLCQMREGGRSVAELAVKGKIVKRLPRKLSVVEGENAAFCVELDEAGVDVRWYKDGELLRETHKTIIKSFGKTHILVLVNAGPEDAGTVTFVISESKSTCQLKVKGRSRSVPGPPVKVRLGCERVNAAWLEWGPPAPAEGDGEGPAGATGYVVERQELGAEEWLQCVTTETCGPVQVLGDSVPAEAQYRFRVCSVNAYGRGGSTLFPGTVHLVTQDWEIGEGVRLLTPAARIRHHLDDVSVTEGVDAEFAVELTARLMGTWHVQGRQIQDDERFAVGQDQCRHSLCIRRAALEDNQAQVTLIAHGVRDSALLYVQAAPVTISLPPGTQRDLLVTAPDTIDLSCRVSRADARVDWSKDGRELGPSDQLTLETSGQTRRLVVQSSRTSDSGQYTCHTADSVVTFCVTVSAAPVTISLTPGTQRDLLVTAPDTIDLSCRVSRADARVDWSKDGRELGPSDQLTLETSGQTRRLVVQSSRTSDSGQYTCHTADSVVTFCVTVS